MYFLKILMSVEVAQYGQRKLTLYWIWTLGCDMIESPQANRPQW